MFGQLQRSALSVQLNIAEGYALYRYRQFASYLSVAYGSAIETQELLELVKDEGVLPPDVVDRALLSCRRSQRLLLGLIKRYRTLK